MNNKQILISIIIPSYNEGRTILEVLNRISQAVKPDLTYEVVVVNDGSKDDTLILLEQNKKLYNQLISYEKNKGKGYAVKKGLEVANGKHIFFQDADLEYDPIEINKFASVINRFDPDVIIGSRFNYSEYTRSHSILNKFGNILITLIYHVSPTTSTYTVMESISRAGEYLRCTSPR